jgi:nucleoside 2-deoxyribosyltransferase
MKQAKLTKQLKVYIAAKFEDVELYRDLKSELEIAGFYITTDWTEHKKVHPFSKHKSLCNTQSLEDCMGIQEADCIVLLYNGKKGSGMSFELGYATALRKKIFMVSTEEVIELGKTKRYDTEDYSMFVHMSNFLHCKNKEHLFTALKEFEKRNSQ